MQIEDIWRQNVQIVFWSTREGVWVKWRILRMILMYLHIYWYDEVMEIVKVGTSCLDMQNRKNS
jgi:hypothetical protein